FRLYARIHRRAGTSSCWESIPNMATACQMSLSKARKALRFLVAAGLVSRSERVGATTEWTINSQQYWIEAQRLEALRKQLNQVKAQGTLNLKSNLQNSTLKTPIKSDTPITFDTPTTFDTPIKSDRTTPTKSDRPPLSDLIDEGTPIRYSPEGSSPLTPQRERENSNFKFQNSEPNQTAVVEPLDSTDSLVNLQNLDEDKFCAATSRKLDEIEKAQPEREINQKEEKFSNSSLQKAKNYDSALGIRPPVDWTTCQQRHFDWIPDGPWKVAGKLDPNFVTWQALDWQKAYGGDLHKKKADVLRHFKKDAVNLAIAWEQYRGEQLHRYENAAVRMHNGLEIKPGEQQQLIQHSRAVTEPLPEEINPVATAIQPLAFLKASPVSCQEVLPSATEPIEVFENSFVPSSAEDEERGQHKPEKVFNHLDTPEYTHLGFFSRQSLYSNSVSTDSTGMTENSNAYREWKAKPIEGEPVTPKQFRAKLSQ
ncbi:MAG: hypothetical protein ACRDEA_11140, partial [Microcystaceae cyanobacterium]